MGDLTAAHFFCLKMISTKEPFSLTLLAVSLNDRLMKLSHYQRFFYNFAGLNPYPMNGFTFNEFIKLLL